MLRPVKEQKAFSRTALRPGERKTITWTLTGAELGNYDAAMRYAMQPGVVEVMVGGSSRELPLRGRVRIL